MLCSDSSSHPKKLLSRQIFRSLFLPPGLERNREWQAVPQPDQGFRRRAHQFKVIHFQIDHVGRRICRPQHPVGVHKAALHVGAEPARQHCLKYVAFPDVLFCPFHNLAIILHRHVALEAGTFPEDRRCRRHGRMYEPPFQPALFAFLKPSSRLSLPMLMMMKIFCLR